MTENDAAKAVGKKDRKMPLTEWNGTMLFMNFRRTSGACSYLHLRTQNQTQKIGSHSLLSLSKLRKCEVAAPRPQNTVKYLGFN